MHQDLKLSESQCRPCGGKEKPFTETQANEYLKYVEGWQLASDAQFIYRDYLMKNFMAAVQFINRVAEIAETNGHHPDFHLTGYRKLKIELSTHAIGGLSMNDFIMAAKINTLPVDLKVERPKAA